MEEYDLSGVPVVVLESLRIRLSQLVHSLSALNNQVHMPDLPPWPTLQQQFNVALLQLSSLASTLASYAKPLQKAVVYPVPSFPLKTQPWLVTTLLRKKNLPEVDEWIQEGIEANKENQVMDNKDFAEWALEVAESIMNVGAVQTELPRNSEPNGWPIDKIIAFMSGQNARA